MSEQGGKPTISQDELNKLFDESSISEEEYGQSIPRSKNEALQRGMRLKLEGKDKADSSLSQEEIDKLLDK